MTAHAETTNLWPKTAISANTGPSGKNSALCGILPVKSLTYSGKSWSDQGKFWNLHALCLSVTGSREGAANSWTPAKDSFAFFRNFINQEKTNFSATAGLKHLKQGQPGISWKRQVDLEKPAQQVCFKWLVLTSAEKKRNYTIVLDQGYLHACHCDCDSNSWALFCDSLKNSLISQRSFVPTWMEMRWFSERKSKEYMRQDGWRMELQQQPRYLKLLFLPKIVHCTFAMLTKTRR